MDKLSVELGKRTYNIHINRGLLSSIGGVLVDLNLRSRNILVCNPMVFSIYGDVVLRGLATLDIDCRPVLIPDGEEYKDIMWAYHILTEMLQHRLDRKSCLFALGGGVVGDITGFAASLYMRGIPFVQIPTTLLAQVDSSVGGKTGVNHLLGKNMIGTFYQPASVVIDTDTLATLPEREYLCGLAEVIKYGIISDAGFFAYLDRHRAAILKREPDKLIHIIKTSCAIKARVVSQDEREAGLRAILNYGHTIGHALETETNYSFYKHGEAVAIGMALEARLAEHLKMLSSDDAARIIALIDSYGLPSSLPTEINAEALLGRMMLDKKTEAGNITVITPVAIGDVRITKSVSREDFMEVLSS